MKNKQLTVLIILIPLLVKAQRVDLENFGSKNPFAVSGGISANSIFFESNQGGGREPFTYFLQGGLNIGLYSFSIPLSYSYTNQGDNLDYQLPFDFNRLSLHPKYKWVTAHIGDVAMTFSPYTLSGHQFTGAGLELSPGRKFKFSGMYGRLLKAIEDDANPRTLPAYKRIGTGIKTSYASGDFSLGLISFYARDEINSIATVPEEKGVVPMENLVVSLEGSYRISDHLNVSATYSTSALTKDLRAPESEQGKENLAGFFFNHRSSTEYFKAITAGVNYNIANSSLGVTYEKIDPGYETLGAYFFNNDFENITINTATAVFNNKLNLAFNVGYQRDDLKNQKENATNRMVVAVNATVNPSDKLNFTGSYSNFRTFTNVKTNQFDVINDENLLDNNLDTLNYRQLSQNATLGMNYMISKGENLQQNLVLNYNVSDVANEQNGVVRIGDATTFHNLGTSYSVSLPQRQMRFSTAINATYISTDNATTWGPTLGINKRFFENRLSAGLSSSYNVTDNRAGKVTIANIRAHATYVLKKKHNFSLNIIQLFRSAAQENSDRLRQFTCTFGYNYAFNLLPRAQGGEDDNTMNH